MTPAAWPGLTPLSGEVAPDRLAVRARGCRVFYAGGGSLRCGTSGLWNANLGHGHPGVAERVVAAVRDLGTLPLFRVAHAGAEEASGALLEAVGDPRLRRVVWTESGAGANEAAVKLSRQAHALAGHPERRLVVALEGSYHGLGFGAGAHTGEDLGQRLYGMDQREVRFVAPDDLEGADRLVRRFGPRIACIVVEPVLGSGTVPLPRAAHHLLAAAAAAGAHVVVDEVATGFGRTGPLLAGAALPACADLLLLSKGLTNGAVPGAAVCVADRVTAPFEATGAPFLHAGTGAGHPVTTAATLGVLDALADGAVLAAGARAGDRLGALLDQAVAALDVPARHTGRGLFRSLHWGTPEGGPVGQEAVGAALEGARTRGALLHPGPGCLQFVPPLVSTDADLEALVDAAVDAITATADDRAAVLA